MVAAYVARVLRDTSRLPLRVPRRGRPARAAGRQSGGNLFRLCNVCYIESVIRIHRERDPNIPILKATRP